MKKKIPYLNVGPWPVLPVVLTVLVAMPVSNRQAMGAKPKDISQEQNYRKSEKNLGDVEQKVIRIIEPRLSASGNITADSRFAEKADAKQLETIRTTLEKEFEVLLSPTAFRKAATVRDLSRYILLVRVVQPWVMMRARQLIDASSTTESALTFKKASREDYMRTWLERDFGIEIDPRQFKEFKNLAELIDHVSAAFSERLRHDQPAEGAAK